MREHLEGGGVSRRRPVDPLGAGNQNFVSPITLVNSVVGAAATNNLTTSAIDTTNATLIVLAVADMAALAAGTITDSASNTWTLLTPRTNTVRLSLYYAIAPTTSATHTFSYAGAVGATPGMCVMAFSRVKATSPLDQTTGADGGAVATLATGSITPGTNNEVVVAIYGADVDVGAIAIDSGFATTLQCPVAGNQACAIAEVTQPVAAAIAPTFTTASAPNQCSAIIASFLRVAGAQPP